MANTSFQRRLSEIRYFLDSFNFQHIPKPIWALSVSTLLMTLSGSIVFTIAPHYLVDVLKLNKQSVGWMESIVESFALMVRIISGSLSDYFVQRKLIIFWGYVLSTLAKLGMPFAYSVGFLYITRITERIGNGLQAAPREALVGDLAPENLRGACYGVRNAFGKAGSSLGALIVFIILFIISYGAFSQDSYKVISANTYRLIFLIGIVPSIIACVILYLFVQDAVKKTDHTLSSKKTIGLRFKDSFYLGQRFWLLMIVVTVFNFSHFSETFLQLRAREIGVSLVFAPLVMVLMNLTISIASYPVGKLSDQFGRRRFLTIGFLFVILADILLAYGNSSYHMFMAIVFWGIQMAMTQGMIATLITDTTVPQFRGTAFGIFNLLTALSYLIAGPMYGWLWDECGGQWPFLCSAILTFISLILVYTFLKSNFFIKPQVD